MFFFDVSSTLTGLLARTNCRVEFHSLHPICALYVIFIIAGVLLGFFVYYNR